MKTLKNRVAVITGASSGIGRAIAIALANHGAHVYLTGRDQKGLEETAAACKKAASVNIQQLDVTKNTGFTTLRKAILEKHEAVDILINNAGILHAGGFVDTTLKDWQRVQETNVNGVVRGCQAFLPGMIKRAKASKKSKRSSNGHIVNIASAAGLVGMQEMSTYSASKFAVVGLGQSLRAEMARFNIGVTTICPGMVNTPIAEKATFVGSMGKPGMREKTVKYMQKFSVSPEKVAKITLQAIQKNHGTRTVGMDAKTMDALQRLVPSLLGRAMQMNFMK